VDWYEEEEEKVFGRRNSAYLHTLSQVTLLARLGRLSQAHTALVGWLPLVPKNRYPVLRMAGELALADLLRLQGEQAEAVGYIERSLAWALETGHQEIHCRASLTLGRVRLAQDQPAEAHQAVEEARAIAVECGFRLFEIDCLTTAGRIALARRDVDAALQAGRAAAALAGDAECGYTWGEGSGLHLQGEALARLGKYTEARKVLDAAFALRERISDPRRRNTQRLLQQIAGR
jgi:tetratricopeptide (TPR) repeat protein